MVAFFDTCSFETIPFLIKNKKYGGYYPLSGNISVNIGIEDDCKSSRFFDKAMPPDRNGNRSPGIVATEPFASAVKNKTCETALKRRRFK